MDALGFSLHIAITLETKGLHGAMDKGSNVERSFRGVQCFWRGEEGRGLGLKDRAAVVKGLLGDVVRADLAGDCLDFEFVVADERAVERKFGDGADGLKILQGLRSHLAETVASDHAFAAAAESNALSDAQHQAAAG